MIDEAIEFATKAHAGQFRKGTKRPYIVHPVEVADIVATMTQDEEIICAAVLHDTIEDCEGITEEVLREYGYTDEQIEEMKKEEAAVQLDVSGYPTRISHPSFRMG